MLQGNSRYLMWLTCACLALAGCREETPTENLPATVLVQPVESVAGQGDLVFSGEVRARHEVDLGFRVAGKLLARLVDVGASVSPGMPLARLDPADLQLNVTATRAQVKAAESDLALAKAEMDRQAALLKEKFISQALYDVKETAYKAAEARLAQARAQLSLSGNQSAYAELTDKQPGVVTAVFAEAGQVVAAGQPVVRLARPGEREVLIDVPENLLAQFKAQPDFQVSLWADARRTWTGRLRELAQVANPNTRTYAARITLPDVDAAVRLGMTARVRMPGQHAQSLVKVPLAALIERGNGAEVWLVASGKVSSRKVKVHAYLEDGVLLDSGVSPGEQVVAVGAHRLAEGQSVKPRLMTRVAR